MASFSLPGAILYRDRFVLQTTDATETSNPFNSLAGIIGDAITTVTVRLSALQDGGANMASWNMEMKLRYDGSAASIVGVTQSAEKTAGAAAWDATLGLSTNSPRVFFTGAAATTINWVSDSDVLIATAS